MKTYIRIILILFVYSLIMITLPSCDTSTEPDIPNYQLVWQDEFDGPAGQSPGFYKLDL